MTSLTMTRPTIPTAAAGSGVPYVGNGHYCYANSTSMLLASSGYTVSPSTIEVLSAVGLGAVWKESERLFFFGHTAPDVGVSRALDVLGFAYEERAYPGATTLPLDDLRAALTRGPVALGPLDIGHLTHMPGHRGGAGSDHYVLAYGIQGDDVLLHDPAGFPHALLPLADLDHAWRAERLKPRAPYRSWARPDRPSPPTDEQVRERALAWFREGYAPGHRAQAGDAGSGAWIAGIPALRAFTAGVRTGDQSKEAHGMMVGFLFPLGARRALDYASFFGPFRPDLAALKQEQAVLHGRCHSLAMRRDFPALAEALDALTETEAAFAAALLA